MGPNNDTTGEAGEPRAFDVNAAKFGDSNFEKFEVNLTESKVKSKKYAAQFLISEKAQPLLLTPDHIKILKDIAATHPEFPAFMVKFGLRVVGFE